MEVMWGRLKEKAHEELQDADEYRRMASEMDASGEHHYACVLKDIADEEEIHMKHLTDMLGEKHEAVDHYVESEEPVHTAF